ncbi:MAG: phosphopantetheine-binding protein [bacterium]|nr:phosphopantetheine-binding protein [bacterium]
MTEPIAENLISIINEILADAGRDTVSELSAAMCLREDLGFDSIELAVLTANLEAEYNVDIFANGIVRTIGEVIEKLESGK